MLNYGGATHDVEYTLPRTTSHTHKSHVPVQTFSYSQPSLFFFYDTTNIPAVRTPHEETPPLGQ